LSDLDEEDGQPDGDGEGAVGDNEKRRAGEMFVVGACCGLMGCSKSKGESVTRSGPLPRKRPPVKGPQRAALQDSRAEKRKRMNLTIGR
jgi:hypothetical protein